MKKSRTLFVGEALTSIKVADKPLTFNPEIKELSIPEFNELMSKHRGTKYEYCESIFTTDESFQFTEQTKPVQMPLLKDLVVCWINETVGYGVYTTRNIKKGEPIVVYTGELCRPKNPSTYAIGNIEQTKTGQRVCAVDAKSRSGMAGFFQSALDPREYYSIDEYPLQTRNVVSEYRLVDGVTYSVLFPVDDIPAGKQLLVDYGLDYFDALAECGIVERAFSETDHTQTPPAELFTFSDDYTIPLMIHMLSQDKLLSKYQTRILDNLIRFHHSLLKFLPLETQQKLHRFITQIKKINPTHPLSSCINLFAHKNTPPHKKMTECYKQKLSALAHAADFVPDQKAKPLISHLNKTDDKAVLCPPDKLRPFFRLQLEADGEAKKGDVEKALDLYNQAIQGFSNIFRERCARICFGHCDVVVHPNVFNVHVQLMHLYSTLDKAKAFHHGFICNTMLEHPDINSKLHKDKISEIKRAFNDIAESIFTPTAQATAQLHM